MQGAVELEVIAQVQVEDRQNGQRGIKFLVGSMQSKVHRFEIDLKSCSVLLLLSNQLLLFVFETSLLFLKLVLSHSCLMLSPLILFFFGLIEQSLLVGRDGNGFLCSFHIVKTVMTIGSCQLLELVVLIVLLSVEEFPLEVTIGEFFLVFVDKILVIILLGSHLDLNVSELVILARVELVIHLGVHSVLEVHINVLASLHPLLLSERHIACIESHDISFLAECTVVPLFLILTKLLAAVLQVNDYIIAIIELALLAVDSRSTYTLEIQPSLTYLG